VDSKILGNRIAWDKKNYSFSLFRIYGAPRKPTFPIGFIGVVIHLYRSKPAHSSGQSFKNPFAGWTIAGPLFGAGINIGIATNPFKD
tara:strand:+ start:1029 stop:1289 length:261 start_codon:yes stop_codon:yes gene_type:complete